MKTICIITRKLLIYLSLLLWSFTGISQQLPKALILTGNGNEPEAIAGYPPWIHEFHNQMVSDILKDIVVTKVTSDLSVLNKNSLNEYDLIISYSLFLCPSAEQLEALYQFISQGKSLLTIHCGILSFLNWDKYEEIMGGVFIGGPSTEPESFNVSTTNMEFWGYKYAFRPYEEHPVSKATTDFVIKDEMYSFQPTTPHFYVIARAENHPVMWWHPVGKGKVMCFTLGHSEEAKQNPGYQQLLKAGVQWLMNYPLIELVSLRPLSTRNKNYPSILRLQDFTYSNTSESLKFNTKDNEFVTLTCDETGTVDAKLSGKTGTGTITVEATNQKGLSAKNLNVTVVSDGEGNIASYYGNTVVASSTDGPNFLFKPECVIDGDLTTRWSGSHSEDTSRIEIDLQKTYPIQRIVIIWEDSYATNYTVHLSESGSKWNTAADVKNSDGKTDVLTFPSQPARYIRVICEKRARPIYGYSFYEIEIYKTDGSPLKTSN